MQDHEKALAKEEKALEEIQESLKGIYPVMLCPPTTESISCRQNSCFPRPDRSQAKGLATLDKQDQRKASRHRPSKERARNPREKVRGRQRSQGRGREHQDQTSRREGGQGEHYPISKRGRCDSSSEDRKRNSEICANGKLGWRGNLTS